MQRNVWLVVALAVASGCKGHETEGPTSGSAKPVEPSAEIVEGKPVKRGTLHRPEFAFLGVIAPPGADTSKLADIAKQSGDVTAKAKTPEDVGWRAEEAQWYGAGYPAADLPAISKATYGLAITSTGKDAGHRVGLAAMEVARACHGWISDPHAHQLYTADTLAPHVPGSAPLDVRQLTVVHQVGGEGELAFLDTAGLDKFGLPELYLVDVPMARAATVTSIVNAAAQTLLERGDLTRDGELDVDVSKLTGDWHAAQIAKDGGTGKVTFEVRWSRADTAPEEKVEPFELHLQLSLKGTKPGSAEALIAAEEAYFGSIKDPVHEFDYQDELDAAAVNAREALTKLRPHFAKGIPLGEQLAVKAPFPMDGGKGNEWMWVDVVSFKGDVLDGTLDNEPEHVSTLKLGARVKVKLGDVADFIHRTADGKHTGGFSLEVMRKHGEDVPPL